MKLPLQRKLADDAAAQAQADAEAAAQAAKDAEAAAEAAAAAVIEADKALDTASDQLADCKEKSRNTSNGRALVDGQRMGGGEEIHV